MSGPPALVLTAGLGTRLQPLTYIRAKAAVPVNGETLARRAVRWLVSQGVTDLVLNLHHRPETITGSVGDGSDMGAAVRYSWEQPLLGSAGGPRHALPLLTERGLGSGAPQSFYIVNGDTLTNVDLGAMRARHVESGARVTMALIPNPRPDKYGGVLVDGSGVIIGFTRAGATPENYHFVGVQCADPGVFTSLPDGVAAESVNSLYRNMLTTEPGALVAFVSDATFQDIGTPTDYLRTSLRLAEVEGDHLARNRNVEVPASALVLRTAVWDDVVIGAHSRLVDCVIADGARIPDHAYYERCAIVPVGGRTPVAGEQVIGELLIAPLD
jgi:NDP-sugar pyrophosphorylase family protein